MGKCLRRDDAVVPHVGRRWSDGCKSFRIIEAVAGGEDSLWKENNCLCDDSKGKSDSGVILCDIDAYYAM